MGYFGKGLLAVLFGAVTGLAHAAYPDKPLHLIVPYPPGGNIDSTARIIANHLSPILGQTVTVENRSGAAGMLGAGVVARAAPDGYTMLLGSSGALAPAKASNPAMTLDPDKDFVSAGAISRTPLLLVVGPSVPSKTLKEFIAYAKQNPGKLTMASSGTGGNAHLTGELFQSMSGTKFLHVPYKGSGQTITDLVAGRVDLIFSQPAAVLPQMGKGGKLRALGVTTLARSEVTPDMPTVSEEGLPGFETSTTTGILFPAGTPKAALDKVNAALVKVLSMPQTRKEFADIGADAMTGKEDFSVIVRSEIQQWTKVIQDAGLKIP